MASRGGQSSDASVLDSAEEVKGECEGDVGVAEEREEKGREKTGRKRVLQKPKKEKIPGHNKFLENMIQGLQNTNAKKDKKKQDTPNADKRRRVSLS